MNKGQKFSAWYLIAALIIAWLFSEYIYKPYTEGKTEVPYSEFLADLNAGNIENADISESREKRLNVTLTIIWIFDKGIVKW